MKNITKTLTLAALAATTTSAMAVPLLFNGTGNGTDTGTDIVVDNLGISCGVGTTLSAGKNLEDILVVRRNILGAVLWSKAYNTGFACSDNGVAIATDNAGNYYVCGTTQGPIALGGATNKNVVILKYSAGGALVATQSYAGPAGGDDVPYDIQVLGGNVYVVGSTKTAAAGTDMLLIKCPTTLATLAVATYGGSANLDDAFVECAMDPAGNIYACGTVRNVGTGRDMAIVSVDPAFAFRWSALYNGIGNGDDRATGIAADALGQISVCGTSYGGVVNGDEGVIVAWTAGGVATGLLRFNRVGNKVDGFTDIDIDSANNVYACGYSESASVDYLVVKANPALIGLWSYTFDGTLGGTDVATSLGVTPAECFVTGVSQGTGYVSTPNDMVTLGLTSAGALSWNRTYDQSGNYDGAMKLFLAANDLWLVGRTEDALLNSDMLMDRRLRTTGVSVW